MRSKLPAVALRYAFATGFMIAGYTTFAGMGVRLSGSIFTYIIWSELLVSLGIILFCLVFRKQGILPYFKIHWLSVSFISILAVSSFGLVLWVFNYLPVGPVAAVRESSIAFAVLFSAIFLREKIQSHKIIALLLVAVGVIILALQK
jgi:uncharacterized membrane protein